MAELFRKTRRARKQWKCDNGDIIEVGDIYIDEATPPWTMTCDDPDGTPFKLGEWYHVRYHRQCYGPMWGY